MIMFIGCLYVIVLGFINPQSVSQTALDVKIWLGQKNLQKEVKKIALVFYICTYVIRITLMNGQRRVVEDHGILMAIQTTTPLNLASSLVTAKLALCLR